MTCKTNLFLQRFIRIFLIIFISVNVLNAQTDQVTICDNDFEDANAFRWDLGTGWDIEKDDTGNHYLRAQGHQWASFTEKQITSDYIFKGRIKLVKGGFNLHFRVNGDERYIVNLRIRGIALSKESPRGVVNVLQRKRMLLTPNNWNDVEINLQDGEIQLLINKNLQLQHKDITPINGGITALESLLNSIVNIDDIEIMQGPRPDIYLPGVWRATGGPLGGLGYDIRIHPTDKSIMFVTDNPSGVNKSYDYGESWFQKNEGITTRDGQSNDDIPIFSLTIDPSNPHIVWAGTQEAKAIYRSTDTGESWVMKVNGVTEGDSISFRGFAVHPNDSNTVLAAAQVLTKIQGIGFELSYGKIYKTTDFGENWRSVWEGPSLARVLIYDPNNPNIVYCSTGIFDAEATNSNPDSSNPGGVGVLKSIDGGENWFATNRGLTNLHVGFLEMHPTDSRILFAAAHSNSYWGVVPSGIFRTTDRGRNWEMVSPIDAFTVVTISKFNPNIIYAGSDEAFYRSIDGGDNWVRFAKPEGYFWGPPGIMAGFPISAVVDPDNSDKVFVNNYGGGNFISEDGGENWRNGSRGYSGADMRDIAVAHDNSAKVYTVGRSGPFYSNNGGYEWEGMAFGTAGFCACYAIAVFPDNSAHILSAADDSYNIVKSTDSGRSWRVVYEMDRTGQDPMVRHGAVTIAISPYDHNIVYAGTRKVHNVGLLDPAPDPSLGILKSIDRGETWEPVNNGLNGTAKIINVIAAHPGHPEIAYAGTYMDGIYRTLDGGESWVRKSDGLKTGDVRSLAIDPVEPNTIYAGSGSGDGLYKTINGGESWQEINVGIQLECPSYLKPIGNTPIGWSFEKPRQVFYNYFQYPPWTRIFDIIIDPNDHRKIYAADLETGMYMSTDAGANWIQINTGLNIRAVTCLTISSDSKKLYAGTSGGGVYSMDL